MHQVRTGFRWPTKFRIIRNLVILPIVFFSTLFYLLFKFLMISSWEMRFLFYGMIWIFTFDWNFCWRFDHELYMWRFGWHRILLRLCFMAWFFCYPIILLTISLIKDLISFSIYMYFTFFHWITLASVDLYYLVLAPFVYLVVFILSIILTVAFITLLERKLIASVQRRRGPSKAGLYGVIQAFADAIKLFGKEFILPKKANLFFFLFAPILAFFISFVMWSLLPFSSVFSVFSSHYDLLFLFSFSSLGVYSIFLSGWASHSRYAFLGGLRSVAQMLSYELSFGVIFLFFVIINGGDGSLLNIMTMQHSGWNSIAGWNVWPFFFLWILFFFVSLAELNRVPFDLPEAEAELVSGYNIEYSSLPFVLFFLGEYSMMLVFSTISSLLFFGGYSSYMHAGLYGIDSVFLAIKIISHMYLIILVRACLPRYRYDQLIKIGWKLVLPLTCFLVYFYVSIYYIFIFA